MNKFIKSPSFSTGFSESGKSAKNRFDNILNTKSKKTGVLAFIIIAMLIGIVGTLISCNKEYKEDIPPITRAGDGPRFFGTAILTKDVDLFDDVQNINTITTLKKNDLIYVLYHQNDDLYYIQRAIMNIPPLQGYISKSAISFDENLFANSNYGTYEEETKIYKSPSENDVYEKPYIYGDVFEIVKRQGEWTQINMRGGNDGKWIKTADISYDLIPYQSDLSYAGLSRE